MKTRPPPDADTLASALAARYAGRWARAVARSGGADVIAPWLVDGFAGTELQRAALRGASMEPAAVAAVRAVDAAADGGARIVLVEEDPGLVARLVEELHGIGAGARVRLTADPASAQPGDVTIVEAPFAAVAARLAERIGGEPALVRLAPLTARALPWPALHALAALPATDLLLRVPAEDFAKQARFTGPLADLPPHLRRVVEGCSALLADPRHGWIAGWREAERAGRPDAALAAVVDRLHDMLVDAGDERRVHLSRVEGAPAAVHLILSTPGPHRTLDGDDDDDAEPATVDIGLADAAAEDDLPIPAERPLDDLTPDEPATPTEPPAMLDLFADADAAEQEPAAPAKRRAAAPRPRKPRPPAPGELGLFDDEPEE